MKRRFLVSLLMFFACTIFPFIGHTADIAGDELRLYLGETKVVAVNNPTRVIIGNPEVADVTGATKTELTIVPKAAGSTTLVFWDNYGEQSYQIKVFPENTAEIKRRVDNLLAKIELPEVTTQAEDEEGKVLMLGRVKTPQDKDKLMTVLGPLKEKVVDLVTVKDIEAVIEIEAQVLELDKDATNTLGFTAPSSIQINEMETGTRPTSPIPNKIFKVFTLQRAEEFWYKLEASIQEGKARILSRPRLSCLSGKEAELLVGGEKPIFSTEVSTGGGTGTNVEYKEYGIKLKIKPKIMEGRRINLALNIEVSEVGTLETIGTQGTTTTGLTKTETTTVTASAYPLSKRNVSTELFVDDGQTIAIGGLMKQKKEETITKTPGLGDIPILGMFFRKKSTKIGGGLGERGNTELFITITPTIISELASAPAAQKAETKQPEIPSTPSLEEKTPEPLRQYTTIVQKRVMDSLTYPRTARDAGFQGVTKLSLHLSYKGELLDVLVKSSSGYKVLDDNAVYVAKAISSYPPFPSNVDQKELWIEIPIVYRLE